MQICFILYIEDSNVIILAISSATEDIENSVSIKLAKKYDPEGKRTIGVITKVDLMNEGTNWVKTLQGEKFKLKHGFVAVKWRSPNDIKNKLSIRDWLCEEEDFFRNKENGYSEIAHQQGIRFLREKASDLLKNHLINYLPKIQKDIKGNFDFKVNELSNLPTHVEVKESERESYINKLEI